MRATDIIACILLMAVATVVARVFWLVFIDVVERILGEKHGGSEGHQEDTSVDQEPGR